ncbi:hypothetical protein Ddc_14571 [Ditylenchus destructor]|nr:hypothetical protein Ddc_14571 [Ditylenchus destructor]
MLCLLSVFILVIATNADWVNETRQLYNAPFPPGGICFSPGVAATESDLIIECVVMSGEIYRYGYWKFKPTCTFIMRHAIHTFQAMGACSQKICHEDNTWWNRMWYRLGISEECPEGVDYPGRMEECQYSNMRDKCGPRCQQATKLCKTAPAAHANTDPSQRDDIKRFVDF